MFETARTLHRLLDEAPDLLARFGGYRPVMTRTYWQYPRRGPLRAHLPAPDYFAGLGSRRGYSTSVALRLREAHDDATKMRLDASDPRRGRVTATVPVDERQAVVYQRAYRSGARTLLSRALDAVDEALGRRRLRASAG